MSNSGYCSLIITGDNLDLNLIEDTLKIVASEKRKKGEIINSIVGEVQSDFIRFNEKISGKYNPNKTLISLLNKLINKKVFLKNISKEACIYIECYVQSDYAQVNYMISSTALDKMTQLGIDLEISTFSWGGVKDKKKKKRKARKKKRKKGKKEVN